MVFVARRTRAPGDELFAPRAGCGVVAGAHELEPLVMVACAEIVGRHLRQCGGELIRADLAPAVNVIHAFGFLQATDAQQFEQRVRRIRRLVRAEQEEFRRIPFSCLGMDGARRHDLPAKFLEVDAGVLRQLADRGDVRGLAQVVG